ncbi:cytochrome P450, partial [Streptomyces scabiei]|nr:cytochrome P450 [Streptomyces scabiei]
MGAGYEKLRAEQGQVAAALVHDDVPDWVGVGHGEKMKKVGRRKKKYREKKKKK